MVMNDGRKGRNPRRSSVRGKLLGTCGLQSTCGDDGLAGERGRTRIMGYDC